ncbi:hypothetical protein GV819_18535 [Pseudomonas sp. Fl5BN2]|uniref:three component ABC system middle component n=1 Tax=Pseudomonas sp. Fl5BN2 TaxID=2697652 RepID=UPI0013775492|nr:hypothetical protein [Pseudomonas sp. Fl5BN2]
MNALYMDRHLIHNSSLACFLLAYFIYEYEYSGSDHPIDLPKLLLLLPIIWSPSSSAALSKKYTSSAIDSVLRDSPVLKIDLERRVQEYTASTLQGLNLAIASKLVEKWSGEDGDVFTSLITRWPKGTKTSIPAEMLKTTKQLSSWLASVSTPQIYKLLFGIPNEIRD